MSLLNDLINLFTGHQSNPQQTSKGQQPDITYNPNQNTNIPYSAHSIADAKLGNQYVKNPTSPQFLGVDPARFGFPADNTVRMGSPKQMSTSQQAQIYGNNPQDQRVTGVDPFKFGYAPDNSSVSNPILGAYSPNNGIYSPGFGPQSPQGQTPQTALSQILKF